MKMFLFQRCLRSRLHVHYLIMITVYLPTSLTALDDKVLYVLIFDIIERRLPAISGG